MRSPRRERPMSEPLTDLTEGQQLVVGGDRVSRRARRPCCALRAPATGWSSCTTRATCCTSRGPSTSRRFDGRHRALPTAFDALRRCRRRRRSPSSSTCSPARLADDAAFAPIARCQRGRRRVGAEPGSLDDDGCMLSPAMRADMVAGLRSWRDIADSPRAARRRRSTTSSGRFSRGAHPLGVVGFVFEGRPNVFADATGVLRTGNTVGVPHRQRRARRRPGDHARTPCARRWPLPGCPPARCDWSISAAHAAGWALFADAALVVGRRPRLG